MSPTRIAVIGAGMIGRKNIDVLLSGRPEYTLAAVADPSPAAIQEAARHGYICHPTIAAMLDDARPDGAIIAVPNQMHVAAALACIERGIAVLVEKPITDSVAEGLRLVEAAERVGVPALAGHHRRHNPIMCQAAEVVAPGKLGRIVAVNSMWLSRKTEDYFDIAWRREAGGGPVLINAMHDIDCLRMLCGDSVSVRATTANAARDFPVEDTAAAVLTFAFGAIGTLLVSDRAAGPWSWEWGSRENAQRPFEPENCYIIAGTQGSLTVPSLQLRWYDAGRESWGNPLTQQRLHVALKDAYHEQMRNFAAVIRGTEAPRISGRGGVETLATTLATTLAISEAARTDGTVLVADMLTAG